MPTTFVNEERRTLLTSVLAELSLFLKTHHLPEDNETLWHALLGGLMTDDSSIQQEFKRLWLGRKQTRTQPPQASPPLSSPWFVVASFLQTILSQHFRKVRVVVDDCLSLQDTHAEMVDGLLNGIEANGEDTDSTEDSLFSILAGPSTPPLRAHLHQLGHMLESGRTNETEDIMISINSPSVSSSGVILRSRSQDSPQSSSQTLGWSGVDAHNSVRQRLSVLDRGAHSRQRDVG